MSANMWADCSTLLTSRAVFQIEYLVVAFDENAQKVRLSLAQVEILESLAKAEAARVAEGLVPLNKSA